MRARSIIIVCSFLGACAAPLAQLPNEGDAGPDRGAVDAGADAGAGPMCSVCTVFAVPQSVGPLPSVLNELSGLAASRAFPGVLYGHNDSGDSARFFALDPTGILLGTSHLRGASAVDWEDMAVGPCDAGSCVFIADIGDNQRQRTDLSVYVVKEPPLASSSDVPFTRLRFQYPGAGAFDAEALLVHPVTGRIYVATKPAVGSPSEVFRFPSALDETQVMTLEKVATLPLPNGADSRLTGGDIDPCGRAVAWRMYNRVALQTLPADAGAFEDVFAQPAQSLPTAAEVQGESVAFSADGQSLFTGSERVLEAPTLNQTRCRN